MHQEHVLRGRNLKPLQALQTIRHIMVVPVQVRPTIILLFLLALRTVSQLPEARLRLLWWTTRQGLKDVRLVPKHHKLHLRLVLILLNKILTTYHQCNYQINSHHLLISSFRFHPQPIAPSNVSNTHSAPVSDISAAITLMTNTVTQDNSNTTAITNALERTTTQFADALQQTIQMGVDAQAQENKNAKMDKQFEKVKVFDGSRPSKCHPWLEEVHALCIQTGRPFREMLLLCAGQAVCDFITDMSPEVTDDQIKNDLITGYSDLQGLGCKQAAYDNIMQRPDEPLRSYIMRYSRLFKLLNGMVPNDVKMRTMSMHFVNSLCNCLSSLGMWTQGNSLREATCCIDKSGGSRPASGTAAVWRD